VGAPPPPRRSPPGDPATVLRLVPLGVRPPTSTRRDLSLVADGRSRQPRATRISPPAEAQLADCSIPRNSPFNGKTRARLLQPQPGTRSHTYPECPTSLGLTTLAYAGPHQACFENFLISHVPSFAYWALGGSGPSTHPRRSLPDRLPRLRSLISSLNCTCFLLRSCSSGRRLQRRRIRAGLWTTTGPLAAAVLHPAFRRRATLTRRSRNNFRNGVPDADHRSVIDAGFRELVPLGERPCERSRHRAFRCRSR